MSAGFLLRAMYMVVVGAEMRVVGVCDARNRCLRCAKACCAQNAAKMPVECETQTAAQGGVAQVAVQAAAPVGCGA